MTPTKSDIETIVKSAEKGPSTLRRMMWATVLIVVAFALWLWWSSGSGQNLPVYTTQAIVRSDVIVQVTATGTVEPTDQVEISSELSGTVRSVEADFNDLVTTGQILARLDTDKLEANVELAAGLR
jgi:HlyD family secretion protein